MKDSAHKLALDTDVRRKCGYGKWRCRTEPSSSSLIAHDYRDSRQRSRATWRKRKNGGLGNVGSRRPHPRPAVAFCSEKKAPLNGTVSFKAKTSVPPGHEPFLKKLRLIGDFGIDSALFTKEETQKDLEKLSAAGRGQPDQAEDSEDIVSELQGHVDVKDGIATFSDLRFRVPGARARLQGTFNLIDQKVDFRGLLFMDAKLPKATTGIKSFLLKAVDPFLKKNRHGGARIPVSITGTYQHPSYKSDPV